MFVRCFLCWFIPSFVCRLVETWLIYSVFPRTVFIFPMPMLPPTRPNRHTPYSINPIVAIYVASQFPRCSHPSVQLTDNNSSYIALSRSYRTILKLCPFGRATVESFTRICERKTRFLYVQEYNRVLDGWVSSALSFAQESVESLEFVGMILNMGGRDGGEKVKGHTPGTSSERNSSGYRKSRNDFRTKTGWYWSRSQMALWSLRMSEIEGPHRLCMNALMHQWRHQLLWL